MENENREKKIVLKVREALSFGWKKTRQRLLFFIGASFISMFAALLITLPLDIIAILIGGLSGRLLIVFSYLIYYILLLFFYAGFLTILLKALREEGPSFGDFLGKWNYVPRLLGGYLLYYLTVLVGMILFIIPGLILAVRLYFFGFLIIDKGMRPVEALKESYTMTKGYGWKIFFLIFVAAPIILFFGVILFLVGILVAAPIISLAQVFFYGKLLNREEKLSQAIL